MRDLLGSALRTSVGSLSLQPFLPLPKWERVSHPGRSIDLPVASQESGAGNGSEAAIRFAIPISSTELMKERDSAVTTLMNKTAIVTGASSGIGYATAKLFAQEGANVIVTARRSDALNALVAEIEREGGQAIAVAGDIRDEALAHTLVETAIRHFGGLDIAFNNAGTNGEMGPTPGLSLPGWNETLAVNLTAAFLGAKYQIPAMLDRGGGSLIFTSTFVGYTAGMPGVAAYAASKSGLIGLTQSLASEFGPEASASTPCCRAARIRLSRRPGSAHPRRWPSSRACTL